MMSHGILAASAAALRYCSYDAAPFCVCAVGTSVWYLAPARPRVLSTSYIVYSVSRCSVVLWLGGDWRGAASNGGRSKDRLATLRGCFCCVCCVCCVLRCCCGVFAGNKKLIRYDAKEDSLFGIRLFNSSPYLKKDKSLNSCEKSKKNHVRFTREAELFRSCFALLCVALRYFALALRWFALHLLCHALRCLRFALRCLPCSGLPRRRFL